MNNGTTGENRPGLLRQAGAAVLLSLANRCLCVGLRLGGVMSKAELQAAVREEESPPVAAADLDARIAAVIARRRGARVIY